MTKSIEQQLKESLAREKVLRDTTDELRKLRSSYNQLLEKNKELQVEANKNKNSSDTAYRERNILVSVLSKLFPSGIRKTGIPGWHKDWHNCVYVDFPDGQASWHYHTSDSGLFSHLNNYDKEWDGHSTSQKNQMLINFKETN